jgi:sensor domain CHASE-containing protein
MTVEQTPNKKTYRDDVAQAPQNRIETLLRKQQASLQRTHADLALGLGAAMVIAGYLLMVWGAPFAFSITGLVWGSILAALSLWSRTRAQQAQIEHAKVLSDLHVRVTRLSQRQQFVERLWGEGLPTSCSIADVLLLLEAQIGSEQGARS